MNDILVIERDLSGHRSDYLRWIVRSALERGCRITVVMGEAAAQHSAMPNLRRDFASDCRLVILSPPKAQGMLTRALKPIFGSQFEEYAFMVAAHRVAPDVGLVFVPTIDPCLFSIALKGSPFGATPWAGIVMGLKFHFRRSDILGPRSELRLALQERVFMRLLKQASLQHIFTIDETLPNDVAQHHPHLARKLTYLVDPNEIAVRLTRAKGRQHLGLPPKKWLLLLFGALSLRKGLKTLLKAVVSPEWPQEAAVVLAGKQNHDVIALLNRLDLSEARSLGRIYVLDGFLSKCDRDAALAACDAVWCGYEGFYQMSGVLVLAGLAGRPVVACPEGLIGWLTKRYKSGILLSNRAPATVCATVRRLLHAPEFAAQMGANGAQAFAIHTLANARHTVGEVLRPNSISGTATLSATATVDGSV